MSAPETSFASLPPFQSRRITESEVLDETPASEGAASLADMERINCMFGGFRILRKQVRSLAGGAENVHLLDVAAGATGLARWTEARLRGSRVTSLDLRQELLALGAGTRVAADALRLPFRDGSFDVAVSTLFLHHLSEQALPVAISEMLRVSRAGVVAVDLTRHPIAYRFLSASRPLFRWNWITLVDGPRSVQAAFTAPELRQILKQSGFPRSVVRSHHPWFRLSVIVPR